MADSNLSIGKAEVDLLSRLSQAENIQVSRPAPARSEETAAAASSKANTEPQPQTEQKAEKASNPLTDVSLKFRIDSSTQDVTIFILNRMTQQVVRTIPPDEMSKMNPGDLLELFA